MDKLEKVEKLRERANVSYEEARSALEENDWDLLDAMVALEKFGKTSGPKQESFSTSYDQQQEYVCVKSKVEEQRKEQPKLGRSIGEAMHSFFRICRQNFFCIRRNGDLMLRIPLFADALLFGFRYSLEGTDDLKEVNTFMDSAGAAAENLKEGFQNARTKEAPKDSNE